MGTIDRHPGPYGPDERSPDRIFLVHLLESVENQRMMSHHHIGPAFHSFLNQGFGTVECHEHSRQFRIRTSCTQSAIVPTLLNFHRCERFYDAHHVPYRYHIISFVQPLSAYP